MPNTRLDYSIDLVNISKRFRRRTLTKNSYTTIKSNLIALIKGETNNQSAQHITHAIKELTLRIPRGNSVGIIGRNGSGKSTLLKLITGIYKPDQGQISVNGRIAALIELGAGFHPDFSGRENLYLGGTLHGLTRAEISKKLGKIIDFAELQDVIDDPVRTYSSGMFMRLGFSLAIHTDPDILIIDEVLAVGDAAFVNKCKGKIAELRKAGKTLLLVSHDLDAVGRWCDEAVWLESGKVRDRGYPRRVIDNYLGFIDKAEEQQLQSQTKPITTPSQDSDSVLIPGEKESEEENGGAARWGSRELEISAIRALNHDGEQQLSYRPDDAMTIEIEYLVHQPNLAADVVFGIGINRADGLVVHGSNTAIERIVVPKLAKRGTVCYQIRRLGLLDGTYTIDVAAHKLDGYAYDYHKGALTVAIRSSQKQLGVVLPEHSWSFREPDSTNGTKDQF